jgi:hypothetical protein
METRTGTVIPPIGRIFGGHQEISAHAGLRGGARSRIRTRLHSINRDFFKFWARPQLSARHSSNDSVDLEQNSLLNRTGNFCEPTGNFDHRNKELEPGIFRLIFG